MARIDRSALERPDFGHVLVVPTRYGDLDQQAHINNAAAAVILQEGRIRFSQPIGTLLKRHGLRMVVASLLIEYAAEMRHPDPVEVRTGLLEIGRSSMTLGQIGRQGGTAAIYSRAVLVTLGPGGPAPLTDDLRDALADLPQA